MKYIIEFDSNSDDDMFLYKIATRARAYHAAIENIRDFFDKHFPAGAETKNVDIKAVFYRLRYIISNFDYIYDPRL